MSEVPDILGSDPRPAFFPVADPAELGLVAPEDRLGLPVRTWVRALAGMQKEALVINGASGSAWRLVSDEGPYLDGHDRAPCPLCAFVTGMVSSYMNSINTLAQAEGLEIDDIELTLANHYTMEGSALKGTMLGGARTPELGVRIAADADESDLDDLARRGVAAAPINGLLSGIHHSLFNLSWNGDQIPVGEVGSLDCDIHLDPGDAFERVRIADVPVADDLMVKVKEGDQVEGVPGGVNSSLQESQSRSLHVQAVCRVRDDGVKEIHENLFRPIGSEFRFLSDEAPEAGGQGLAPDAVSYLAAGLGFCFMTQLGRYARITKKPLQEYRISQDIHFSPGGSGGGVASALPVETHVYLVMGGEEDEESARKTLDMSERTCFLHAACRTDLDVAVSVGRMEQAVGS
jgi:uncharacterized OsmC-like protein